MRAESHLLSAVEIRLWHKQEHAVERGPLLQYAMRCARETMKTAHPRATRKSVQQPETLILRGMLPKQDKDSQKRSILQKGQTKARETQSVGSSFLLRHRFQLALSRHCIGPDDIAEHVLEQEQHYDELEIASLASQL